MTASLPNREPPPVPRPPRVVGLLGGIGSGKSRVARLLAQRGACVLSGDETGHEALRDPAIKARVVARWGDRLLDDSGEIQRKQLARVVFADAAQRHELEELVHPWIGRRLRERLEAARADPACRLVVVDAAVLFEAGWEGLCEELVYVQVPREERLRRLREQRGWTEKEVEARERAQWPVAEKARRAHHTIDNSGSEEDLGRQLEGLLRHWGLDTDQRSATTDR